MNGADLVVLLGTPNPESSRWLYGITVKEQVDPQPKATHLGPRRQRLSGGDSKRASASSLETCRLLVVSTTSLPGSAEIKEQVDPQVYEDHIGLAVATGGTGHGCGLHSRRPPPSPLSRPVRGWPIVFRFTLAKWRESFYFSVTCQPSAPLKDPDICLSTPAPHRRYHGGHVPASCCPSNPAQT